MDGDSADTNRMQGIRTPYPPVFCLDIALDSAPGEA
jgi:hypothetical protein